MAIKCIIYYNIMDSPIFENRIQVLYLNPEVFYLHKMMDSIEYYLGVSVKSQLSATEPVIDIFSTPFNVNT